MLQEHSIFRFNENYSLKFEKLRFNGETSFLRLEESVRIIKIDHRSFLKQIFTTEITSQFSVGTIIYDQHGVPLLKVIDSEGNVEDIWNRYHMIFGAGGLVTAAGTVLAVLATIGILSSTFGIAGFALLGFGLLVMSLSQFDKSLNKMGLFKGEGIKPFIKTIGHESQTLPQY